MSNYLSLRIEGLKKIGSPNSVERILHAINSADFSISTLLVGNWVGTLHAYWDEFDNQILEEIDIVYQHGQLDFNAHSKEEVSINDGYIDGTSLICEIKWEIDKDKEGHFFAYSDYPKSFRNAEYNTEYNSQIVLRMFKSICEVTDPKFGWIELCKFSGYTTIDDIKAIEIPHIYWANYFNKEYLAKYDLDFFENAPGWKNELLSNGGFLYVLSPSLIRSPKSFIQEVKDYFDITGVRCKMDKSV